MNYTFTIPGKPVSKARPRVTIKNGIAMAYMPKEYVKYKNHVAMVARIFIPEPMRCVKMGITAVLCLNKSNGEPSGRKSDLEGIFGSIADGLEGIAYEKDWSVFGFLESHYQFVPYGEPESVIVRIEEVKIKNFIKE